MRIPAPKHLPSLHSRKWHNRKIGDPIGFLRVQHLSCERTSADLGHIILWLGSGDPEPHSSTLADRDAPSKARQLLIEMTKLKRRVSESDDDFEVRLDRLWSQAIKLLDDYTEVRQQEHIEDVRVAGASGI